MEFELILQRVNLKEEFLLNWSTWQTAIVKYAKNHNRPSDGLKYALREQESNQGELSVLCFSVINLLLPIIMSL